MAERSLQLGLLYPAQEALKIGLVDEVVQSNEEARKRAVQVLQEYMKIPSEFGGGGRMFATTAVAARPSRN